MEEKQFFTVQIYQKNYTRNMKKVVKTLVNVFLNISLARFPIFIFHNCKVNRNFILNKQEETKNRIIHKILYGEERNMYRGIRKILYIDEGTREILYIKEKSVYGGQSYA